jgi:hypothetical protein
LGVLRERKNFLEIRQAVRVPRDLPSIWGSASAWSGCVGAWCRAGCCGIRCSKPSGNTARRGTGGSQRRAESDAAMVMVEQASKSGRGRTCAFGGRRGTPGKRWQGPLLRARRLHYPGTAPLPGHDDGQRRWHALEGHRQLA